MVHEAPEIEISSNAGDPSDIRNITGSVSLPTGASTAARQDTGNTSLANIDTKTPTIGQKTMANSSPAVLSSDQSFLFSTQNNTANPTHNISIGASDLTNLRILQGRIDVPDRSLFGLVARSIPHSPATFILNAITIVPANNKSMVSIMNGVSSGVVIRIQSIKVINQRTAAVAGVALDLRLKRITGATGGTLIAPQAFDTNDTLNVNVTLATNATVSGESTADLLRRQFSTDEWGTGTLDVEALDHAFQQALPAYNNLLEAKTITVRPGQGLTFKCVTNTTVSDLDFEIIFTQEVS